MNIDKQTLPFEHDKRKKLSDEDKEVIREQIEDGYSDVDLANKWNVSRTTIYFIRKPKKYSECLEANKRNHIRPSKKSRRDYMAKLRKRKRKMVEDG